MSARILVVDDNPMNLKLAADVLECDGYHMYKAQDAERAQQIIEAAAPDLILMDIALPGMDGLTLTRRIKQDHRLRHVPVIAMTAFAMKGDASLAYQAGCEGYITKPIDTRSLGSAIAQYLRTKNGF